MAGFSPPDQQNFLTDLMFTLLDGAQRAVRPEIPSRRLQSKLAIRILNHTATKGDLFLSPFWAVIAHDGRGGVAPRQAQFLVYFVDPADDPRRPTPDRAANQRRLTSAEFAAGLAENKRLQLINPGGGPFQHMIIVKTPDGLPDRVGPAEVVPFFVKGAITTWECTVDDTVFNKFHTFVCRGALDLSEEIPIRVVLGGF